MQRLIEEARDRARATLLEHRDLLDVVAARLLQVETLEGDELRSLLRGESSAAPVPEGAAKEAPVHGADAATPTTATARPVNGLRWGDASPDGQD